MLNGTSTCWRWLALAVPAAMPITHAVAAKPGGGGSQDTCTTTTDFPSFIYGVTTSSPRSGSTVELRLADSRGSCTSSLVKGIPGAERHPLLISLGGSSWRAVWPDGNGVVVQDFTVDAGAIVTMTASARIETDPVREFEAMGDGGFIYLTTPYPPDGPANALYRVTVGPGGPGQLTLERTFLTEVGACGMTAIAVGADGDSLYFSTGKPDGSRGTIIRKLSILNQADDVANCGTEIVAVDGGHTVRLAAGLCANGTPCVALERHNVRDLPCVPDYYRTDLFAVDDGTAVTTLQLAFPSWGSAGELIGRRTGSTSKNSCTAKIYEELVRHRLDGNLTAGPAEAIGTGRTLDAPNPVGLPL